MKIDHYSKTNLELMRNMRSGKRRGAWHGLDETKTAMGSRLLKRWIDRPLINQMQSGTTDSQELLDHYFERSNLQQELIRYTTLNA